MTQQAIDRDTVEGKGIALCTPMFGGQAYINYIISTVTLAVHCRNLNVPLPLCWAENESLIPRARNYCAHRAMEVSEASHLMWVDADIGFDPYWVLQMLSMVSCDASDDPYDVVAGVYPKKVIKWSRVAEKAREGVSADELAACGGDFVFNRPDSAKNKPFRIDQPIEVHDAGTGFMMVRKATMHKLVELGLSPMYQPDGGHLDETNTKIPLHFHCDLEGERYLSEDYWFCRNVQKAGMKVWVCPWMNCQHKGTYTFEGSLYAHRVTVDEDGNKLEHPVQDAASKIVTGIEQQVTEETNGRPENQSAVGAAVS